MKPWFFEPLRPLHYELIVMDPPWGFDLYSEKGNLKSAQRNYPTMTRDAIMDLPVGQLASMDCLIYLWATAPELPLAIRCLEAWGFQYKSFMVWRKLTANGKTQMGTGYRVRTTGEIILVGALGNPKQAIVPRTIIDGVKREHSRKPEEFYQMCDRVLPQARRCDVFARERRPGWDAFGNELERFAA